MRIRSRLRRQLDGWQAGAALLLLAGSAVFLVVPRAVEPTDLPLPMVDQQSWRETAAQDDSWARAAQRDGLDFDIRMVGKEFRAYNFAAAAGQEQEFVQARRRLMRATARALRRSEAELLKLRAYQLREFIAELRPWQRSGKVSSELIQLGGDILQMLRRNRWCRGSGRELLADERVLRVIYKKRWNDVTGATGGPFVLTRDEERIRYTFLLRYPPSKQRIARGRVDERLNTVRDNQMRLRTIDKLAAVDPSYPAELARGVVLYWLGSYALAMGAFRRHLEAFPDGQYALRATNYLKATLDRRR